MTRNPNRLLAVLAALAGSVPAVAQIPLDTAWTYQGRLTDNGAPAQGLYDVRYSLFSDDLGTVPVGSPQTMLNVSVSAGLFTNRLDFGAQFGGSKRWLKVEVKPAGTGSYVALPIQEITNAPQSLFSRTLEIPFTGSANIPDPGSLFKLTNTNAANGSAIWGQTSGTTGVGVVGIATALTGNAYGGNFESSSVDGRGVRGVATATTGLAIGGRFSTASTGGRGVWSTASATTGTNYGVFGETPSTSGYGVTGQATAASGGTYGVYGLSVSTAGIGVQGTASATTGATSGVVGVSDSTTGIGVQGLATSTSAVGNPHGGAFQSNAPNGRGVFGVASATTGLAIGGRFVSASTDGRGAWSTAAATTGVNYGVFGETLSAAGYGGYFKNSAVGGTALWADGLCKVKTLQILGGADLAEPFNVTADAAAGPIQPGMVVVIDETHPGDLRLTDRPYDTQVAGVISGANGLEPGMVMKAAGHEKADGEHPVAMTGRVWCFVDASFGAIKPGDRLTTSATPGHAMKADDAGRCGGAVIGKAMTGLTEGKALVLVLVNLQ